MLLSTGPFRWFTFGTLGVQRFRLRWSMGAATAILALLVGQPAWAWGADGHGQVGAIAERLLNKHARAELTALLAGFGTTSPGHPDLALGAVWADCARDVHEGKPFYFKIDEGQTPKVCKPLAGTPEADLLIAFAQRNWTQCDYYPGCHAAYHFVDVALPRTAYDPTHQLIGTSDHDVVSAIQCATRVLRDLKCSDKFKFAFNKREAALLLAHYVGDLHQPLHVGAVYLTQDGVLRDPGSYPEDDEDRGSETHGGNSLKYGKYSNLHSTWDKITGSWSTLPEPDAEALGLAKKQPATTGDLERLPEIWATETVQQAGQAYKGVTYSKAMLDPKGKTYWIAQFADEKTYRTTRENMQRLQVAKAGARLAQIYNTIWPDKT